MNFTLPLHGQNYLGTPSFEFKEFWVFDNLIFLLLLFFFYWKKPPLLLCCSLTLTFSNFPPCEPGGGRQNSWFLKNLLYHHHQNENDKKETQRENLGWCLLSRNVGRLRRLRGRDIRCLDLQLFFSIFWCFKRFQTVWPRARALCCFSSNIYDIWSFFLNRKKMFCTVCPLNLLAMSKWAKFKVFFKFINAAK